MQKIITLVQKKDNTYEVEISKEYSDMLGRYKDRILQTAMLYIQTVEKVGNEEVNISKIEDLVNYTYYDLLKENNLLIEDGKVMN